MLQSSQKHSKKDPESRKANSLFDFDQDHNKSQVSGEDDDANFASPTSSQFVHRDKTKRTQKASSVRQAQS